MAERELRHHIVIQAPIEAVWAELTKLRGTGLKLRYALMRAFMWAMPRRTRAEHVRAAEEAREES